MFRIDGGEPEPMRQIAHEDDLTTNFRGFTRDGSTLYLLSSIGRDKAALFEMDWSSGKERLLAEHPKADISRSLRNPQTEVVEAAGAEYLKVDWIPLNERVAADLKTLHGLLPGNVDIVDRTLDDRHWIVLRATRRTQAPIISMSGTREPSPSCSQRARISSRIALLQWRPTPFRHATGWSWCPT